MTDPTKQFTCANCLETFDKGWTDEEASVEFAQNFPHGDIHYTDIVCDDCYNAVMGIEV